MTKVSTQKGFSIFEIVLAIALFMIVTVAVLSFYDVSLHRQKNSLYIDTDQALPFAVSKYSYSNKNCPFDVHNAIPGIKEIDMSGFISTSTKITSIHTENQKLIVTTDSASTTEPDIFVFHIDGQDNASLLYSKDVGPGISSGRVIGDVLYILNTSVNSHIKCLLIIEADVVEISSVRMGELSQSYSLPKSMLVTNTFIYVGSEKNSSGGELFVLPLDMHTGAIGSTYRSIEIGGQVSSIDNFGSYIVVASAADPELYLFEENGDVVYTYDAPLTLGNGKSLASYFPFLFFGRTLGGGEVSLLSFDKKVFNIVDTKRTHGTADHIFVNGTSSITVLTSNQQKEIQSFLFTDSTLNPSVSIDIPDRVTAIYCSNDHLYMTLIKDYKQFLLYI